MGKRKTAKKQMKKEKPKIMSKFDCPFCNHAGSIKISMTRKAKLAQIKCTICNVGYETKITALSEPIDIYSEWIDECEKVNNEDPAASTAKPSRGRSAASRNEDDDDEPEEEENDEDDD